MMNSSTDNTPEIPRPAIGARRAARVSATDLVTTQLLQPDNSLPLVVQPAIDNVNLAAWATNNRQFIASKLLQHGGILFRNFQIKTLEQFEEFVACITDQTLDYVYRSTPRSQVKNSVYTSTEYPADQTIPMHNEMSYTSSWPMKIWFCCLQPSETGGETPIANSANVFNRLEPRIRERFMDKRVMYVRNYGEGLDLSWQNVFQTDDRAEVERFCRSADIAFEWKPGDRLRTVQVCQAVAKHPETGQLLWFNQAHLFHISSLLPQVREALLSAFGEENLPRNTYYGDGTPIEESVLDAIREAYRQETVAFPWQLGDVLMLDNMLVAHSRAPFTGPRRIVVSMAEAYSEDAA